MNDPRFNLAGYEILGKLGEGGMAVVWKARQLSLDRLVAIKTLAPQWLQDPDALARFRQEAQAAARLKHNGIVQVFDAGETKDAVYYIMEYVHGYTLVDRIDRKGPLDEATALQVVLGVAMALEYAWDATRIIHCDIKPDNLMIDQDGTVKVADLGLARALGQKLGVSDRDFIVGTPNYISPEQARGEQNLDCRTDIYALGATLYHMVTGRLPFGDTPGTAPLERQQSDFLLDPLDLNPQLSAPLATLIEKMMVKDCHQRTTNWAEVLSDIQEVQDGFLPTGELPVQGLSTIMRGEWRATHPGKWRSQRAARKKIVISTASATPAAVMPQYRLPAALTLLLSLALLAGLIYVGFLFLRAPPLLSPDSGPLATTNVLEQVPPPAQAAQPHKTPVVQPPAPRASPSPTVPDQRPPEVIPVAPPTPPENIPPPASNPEPLTIPPQGALHSPHYLRAVRFLDYAFELFKNYRGPDMTVPVFNRIEAACRQALSDFKACREMTTNPAAVEQDLMNCTRLLASARLSTKMARPGTAAPAGLPPLPS
ncbi:MAG: serine/threonine-protein kinase, partial [Kiritimatiellaeota bacterium]|nr:serine/threonine-protein kinase [Kiritimatiellota bacterium]